MAFEICKASKPDANYQYWQREYNLKAELHTNTNEAQLQKRLKVYFTFNYGEGRHIFSHMTSLLRSSLGMDYTEKTHPRENQIATLPRLKNDVI